MSSTIWPNAWRRRADCGRRADMGVVTKLIQPDSRRRQLVAAALSPDILLGMPHLTPFGLSETWLLKELGHRHWLMLGQSMGLDDADFRMPDGEEVYAAICASALRDADLGGIVANEILTIQSSLFPVSRTRMASRHALSVDGRSVGTVELISAFVHRANGSGNGGIARVRLPRFEAEQHSFCQSSLAMQANGVRRGDFAVADLPPPDADVLRRHVFTPTRAQDFNAANLFYFVNYQAAIDRALEAWFGSNKTIRNRSTYYVGNIDAGQDVVVKLVAGPRTHFVLERASGGAIAHQVATYA